MSNNDCECPVFVFEDGKFLNYTITLRWGKEEDDEIEFFKANGFDIYPSLEFGEEYGYGFNIRVYRKDFKNPSAKKYDPFEFLVRQGDTTNVDYILVKSLPDLNKYLASVSSIIIMEQLNKINKKLERLIED